MPPRCRSDVKNLQWLKLILETCNQNITRPRTYANAWNPTPLHAFKTFQASHIRGQDTHRARSPQYRSFASSSRAVTTSTQNPRESSNQTAKDSKSDLLIKKPKSVKNPSNASETPKPRKKPNWLIYKEALKKKFPEGWNPRKKISPDAQEGIRALHAQYPEECTKEVLADQFKISQEAVRRILKAKPKRTETQEIQHRERWVKRHDQIWDNMVEIGLRPPRRKARSEDDRSFTLPSFKRSA